LARGFAGDARSLGTRESSLTNMADDLTLVGFLKILASRDRGRVSRFNLYDPNVCTSAFDWREALEDRPPPPDRFRHRLMLKHDGQPITVYSNDHFVAVSARGRFGSLVPFSINRPDLVMPLRRLSKVPAAKKWRVYIGTNAGVPPVLGRPDVVRAIERLALGHHESLHVYGNGLTVYIRPKSADRVADVVAGAATLANLLPLTERPAADFSDLPHEFRALVGLFNKWAKSDDQERADRLAQTSRQRLERLVNQVAPHFASINAYLDRFRDGAVSESAAALGTLAECATEAQLLLAKRGRNPAVPNHRLQPTKARSRKRPTQRSRSRLRG
jgi:hypothetical protein